MKDKIRQIKYSRLKEEERFFLEMIDGIEPFTSYDYPESVFCVKNDIVLFEQDFENKWLRVNHELIWLVLQTKYKYHYDDIQLFIKNMVKKYTLTPYNSDPKDKNKINLEPLSLLRTLDYKNLKLLIHVDDFISE